MIAQFRNKPNVSKYYMLACGKDRKPYYHIDEETAWRHFNIRKKDTSSDAEWTLYHVIEENDQKAMKVLDMIKREKPKTYRAIGSQTYDEKQTRERAIETDARKESLEETLKYLAGELNAEEQENERIPKVRMK